MKESVPLSICRVNPSRSAKLGSTTRVDPDKGYYAGLPGKIFAKILMELWTEITPTGAYWNPTRTVSDNRLAAFESDTSEYTFAAPADGKASVKVTLLFRRAFRELMDQKGWIMADIIMEEEYLFLNGQ